VSSVLYRRCYVVGYRTITGVPIRSAIFFFEVKNVLDKTYVASANNITDTISPVTGLQNPASVLATTGTGLPRTSFA
jgi:iron complex outermembrane recepter protein